jgi:hypothetical protein
MHSFFLSLFPDTKQSPYRFATEFRTCSYFMCRGNFSLHHRVKSGSWAHPASYPMGTRGSFLGSKAAGAWSWPLTCI